ncbi:MAG: HAD family acid phosphatase [Candidatus Eremiobacteraeota bacterium]|nr:HAD family acid phosphatase [Candidatus Eremiobacteraeota bacterium]
MKTLHSFYRFLAMAAIMLILQGEPLFAEAVKTDIPNLSLLKHEIKLYHDSGQWDRDSEKALSEALKHLASFKGKKPAVVFDIDDTCLTNYPYLSGMDFAFLPDEPSWLDWVRKAEAPALKATLMFFRKAKESGFAVFFITGRDEAWRADTERNLEKAGYAGYESLIMCPPDYSGTSAAGFKASERKKLAEKGYTIVVNIGDQQSDLAGGFAEHHVKLPNPMYYIP